MLKKMCGACINFVQSTTYKEYGICEKNIQWFEEAIYREDESTAEDCEDFVQLYNSPRVKELEDKYCCKIDVYEE